jgi:hypothetical protein
MSPSSKVFTSPSAFHAITSWRMYVLEKTNLEFEIPASWWCEERDVHELVAAPRNESVPALSVKTISMRYQTADAAILDELVRHDRDWIELDRSATIQNGVAIVQVNLQHDFNGSVEFMRKSFVPLGDVALWICVRGEAQLWRSRLEVLSHALRTLAPSVQHKRAPKHDPFTEIYKPRAATANSSFEVIEFTR